MRKYPKIQSVFKRDPDTHRFTTGFSLAEFAYLKDCWWLWHEKVDGTNARVGWNGTDVQFADRRGNGVLPAPLLLRLAELITPDKMRATFSNVDPVKPGDKYSWPVVLHGEGYGNKIQKVGKDYNPDGVDFILFDVRVGGWWLKPDDVVGVAESLGIKSVPRVGIGTLAEAVEAVQAPFPSKLGDLDAEGLVLRPLVDLLTRSGQRVIAKLKTKDYQ